jgi:type VI secretion system protein ImpF
VSGAWGPKDIGRVPLFDRLIDDDPARDREPIPLRSLGERGLRASIQKELGRLLSTRCPYPGDVALSRERTILDYGLPDLDQGGRGLVAERRARLAKLVEHTIRAFEPRLADVHVEVVDTGEGGQRVQALIEAHVLVASGREPIALTLPLGGSHVG